MKDEPRRLYQPALLPRQISALYWLKEETGQPMTFHVRRAVDRYLEAIEHETPAEAENYRESGPK